MCCINIYIYAYTQNKKNKLLIDNLLIGLIENLFIVTYIYYIS